MRYYLHLARASAGPVLVLGTGTGRVAWSLAASGEEVVGLDSSDAMLAYANAKGRSMPDVARMRLTLHAGDMRFFTSNRSFGSVIVPHRAFQHLLTETSQSQTLDRIAGHLVENGLLAIHNFDFEQKGTSSASYLGPQTVFDTVTGTIVERRTLESRSRACPA